MPSNEPVRIAMWSGPRNISTAMMRAWGNRPDTFVCDEPFYAYYLKATARNHPASWFQLAKFWLTDLKVHDWASRRWNG